MQQCPGCGYLVPGTWDACRRCGTALATPVARAVQLPATPPPPLPAPVAPATAPTGVATAEYLPYEYSPEHAPAAAVSDGDDFYVRRAVGVTPPAPKKSRRGLALAGAIAVIVLVGLYFTFPGHHHHPTAPPKILAPKPPTNGLPTNLDDVVRMRAESARHTAMQAVEAAPVSATGPTLAQLGGIQPSYKWVAPTEDSSDSTVVSYGFANGTSTLAVAATNGICAFGRYDAPGPAVYVTESGVPHCDAESAPALGWSTQPGGAASDLPDDNDDNSPIG